MNSTSSARTPNPMDESTLLKILREEEVDASSYFSSELAQSQAEAMDRYNARPYGDEVINRSRVVTHDIEDTINWIMPALMRAFQPSEELVACDDGGLPDNDPNLKLASEYLQHVWYKDNAGEINTHDFIFDGLLQKIGILRMYWEPPEPHPPKTIEGITADIVLKYENDPEYEILEITQDDGGDAGPEQAEQQPPVAPVALQAQPMQGPDDPGDQTASGASGGLHIAQGAPPAPLPAMLAQPQGVMGMPGMAPPGGPPLPPQLPGGTFSIKVQRTPRVGRCRIESFPPEFFRISRRARSLEQASYHGGVFDCYMQDVIREYPDKAHDLDPSGGWGEKDTESEESGDSRILARFPDEPDTGGHRSNRDGARRKVKKSVEYIRIDWDDDGIVELRRIVRIGNTILENDAVPETEFVTWSPIRVSHRLIGRSLADTLLDIQKIRTVITRKAMDGLTQTLQPRMLVNAKAVASDSTLLDRLLDHDIGDVIPVDGSPSDVAMFMQTPDVSGPAFQAIEYWDRRSEEASGVNRHAMGIQPQAITSTKGGIENLQAAANSRVEQVARWVALGLQEAFEKLLRIVVTHQDHPRQIKVKGRALNVDPRRWSDDMTVSVHVGMAAESRERKLQYLSAILDKQATVMREAGPDNPIVGLEQLRFTLAQMVESMGYRNPGSFFKQIPDGWAPAAPGPDAKTTELQGKQELAKAELQGRQQLMQAQHQLDQQKTTATLQANQEIARLELQLKGHRAQADAEILQQVAAVKAQSEQQIAQIKIEGEQQLAVIKLAQEKDLAQQRLAQERDIALMKMAQEKELAQINLQLGAAKAVDPSAGDGGSFRPGGRLDA